ncbi:MAG: endonuclease domain-containing protein [Lutibacter sp.]
MAKAKRNSMQHEDNMWKGASPSGFLKAKELREKMTLSEKILWKELDNNKLLDVKFRRQHPIGIYIVDFYAHKLKLIIELDGKYHQNKKQQILDDERTTFLEFNGLKVIRFKNEEILENLSTVIQKIKKEISSQIK